MAKTTAQKIAIPSYTVGKILLAAEAAFAQKGFEGAGMKEISVLAEVSQALLHYHFGTKDRLYAEVVQHRSSRINNERHALLDKLNVSSPDVLSRILEALFRPPLGPAGGAKPYVNILGGLIVGRERDQALVKEFYDPTASRFIQFLESALPGIGRKTAAIGYTLALGSLIAVIGRNGQVERLMGRSPNSPLLETEEILDELITFTEGGIRALAKKEQNTQK